VLTGSCGPNAFQTLQAAGIEVVIGVTGSVKEAAKRYAAGEFRYSAQPNVPAHFGMPGAWSGGGSGYGPGRGMGIGRGRGLGLGRGAGMGYGANAGTSTSAPFSPPAFS